MENGNGPDFNSERIMIFIDNSNIFKGFQKYNIKADYEKFKTFIIRNRKLQSIFLYEGVIYPISQEKKKWYEELSYRSGYEIKTSFDKIASGGVIEKKVDINIAIDIISYAYEDAYDTAVLISGDGDFVPVIKKIKELGKNVEIWAFRYSLANALKEELNQKNIHYIDDIMNQLNL
ncbi:MAG: NYN domain-containing protein [Promethearchaeota archaeon]